jgi:hypothetical protein
MGHSSCTAVSRVGSFVASFVVVSRLPYSTVGLVLGVMNLCAALSAVLLPETAGVDYLFVVFLSMLWTSVILSYILPS